MGGEARSVGPRHLPAVPVGQVDAAQQGREKIVTVIQRVCSTEAASQNIKVAPCEQAHCNEWLAAHACYSGY